MVRTSAYKVTITGFLTYDRKSFDSQAEAIDLLRKGSKEPHELIGNLTAVKVEAKATSFDPDETTQVRRTRGAGAAGSPSGAAGKKG